MTAPLLRRTVPVALGARAYDVVVGPDLLNEAGGRAKPFITGPRAVVVADETVAGLHLTSLTASLERAGLKVMAMTVAPGEASKSWTELERLCEALLDARVDRTDVVIAFGGGVVGDLVGFAAAILNRGVDFIQIPTTLLAQVDSSVGGKTAINAKAGKNLIGAFHQPRLVLADVALLDTLPQRDRSAGFAEIIKIAALFDPDFFAWLEEHAEQVIEGDRAAQTQAVARAVELKARIVEADEREAGQRALLNLGHTFAHAFEAEAGYDAATQPRHGEAVAVGMALAFGYAARLGRIDDATGARVAALIARAGLPAAPKDLAGAPWNAERLLDRMRVDKKTAHGRMRLILPARIGEAGVIEEDDEARLMAFLSDMTP